MGPKITIMLTCTICSTAASVAADAVELHVFVTTDRLRATYRFTCPACTARPIEPATPAFAGVLALADVHLTVGPSAPWQRPPPPGDADAFTRDDLLRFHRELEGSTWVQQLLDADGRS
jgi:hypothetical protein